jgi:hypothetical protein
MRKLIDFIYGSVWGLVKRVRFYFSREGLCYFSNYGNRKTIKMTGIGNCENRVHFYPSVNHFIRNFPCFFNKRNHDYLIAQNFLHKEFLLFKKPKVFFTLEPLLCMTQETKNNMRSVALKPFLYLYDEPDIGKRMFYPALADHREGIIEYLEETLTEKRPRLCCIINRYADNPELNLLQQRIRFVEAMGNDMDIYGAEPWDGRPNKWTEFPNYCGIAEDKQRTLRKYNFVLAFENSDFPGYITEKIVDAFKAGAVPLYWGGGEFLRETFPSDCYIDCRNQNPERIHQMIRNMTQQGIISFRKAALEFLKSDAADRFTGRYLRQEIVKRLERARDFNGF